jgi:hypothetical protein
MTKSSLQEFYDSPLGFHPFRIHLTSGKTLEIEHRENLLVTNDADIIIVVPKGGHASYSIISIAEIAEIISLPKPGQKRAPKQ